MPQGEQLLLWTTFTSEQVDIDVTHPEGRRYLTGILDRLQSAGVRAIRLDAVGYAIKKAGTSCFMIPETYTFIADITAQARARRMEVLVEVHGDYQTQLEVARQVDWVYDFALPPLVLHLLYARDVAPLRRWLEVRPNNAVTVLDTHDGIGVADAAGDTASGRPGLLPPAAITSLIETIHERSRGESRQASGDAARNVDAHQINCTFYDALGRRDDEYLVARAIQCFVPGIPQIYYVGLLAGTNDMERLRRTGEGRDINRHSYSSAELPPRVAAAGRARHCSHCCGSATPTRPFRGGSPSSASVAARACPAVGSQANMSHGSNSTSRLCVRWSPARRNGTHPSARVPHPLEGA